MSKVSRQPRRQVSIILLSLVGYRKFYRISNWECSRWLRIAIHFQLLSLINVQSIKHYFVHLIYTADNCRVSTLARRTGLSGLDVTVLELHAGDLCVAHLVQPVAGWSGKVAKATKSALRPPSNHRVTHWPMTLRATSTIQPVVRPFQWCDDSARVRERLVLGSTHIWITHMLWRLVSYHWQHRIIHISTFSINRWILCSDKKITSVFCTYGLSKYSFQTVCTRDYQISVKKCKRTPIIYCITRGINVILFRKK